MPPGDLSLDLYGTYRRSDARNAPRLLRVSPAMLRSSLGALARRGLASGGGAREVVAAVSELRLPEPLHAREAARAGAAGGAQEAPLELPVQLSPYQALPVDGRITRHFTRGLPVVDPAGRTPQVRSHTAMQRNLLFSGCVVSPERGHCGENAKPWLPRQHSVLTRMLQEREQSVDAVITAYTARLKERTRHHLGCVLREEHRVSVRRLTGCTSPTQLPLQPGL